MTSNGRQHHRVRMRSEQNIAHYRGLKDYKLLQFERTIGQQMTMARRWQWQSVTFS